MKIIDDILNLRISGRIGLPARMAALLLSMVFTNPATFKGTPMKKIPLGNNKGFALIDDEDFELVSQHKWRIQQGNHTDYAKGNIKRAGKGTTMYMHRLLMGEPKDKGIDHIDGDGLNNQRENLRICTRSQNQMNRQKTRGSSQFKGVSWNKDRGKWLAQIKKDGKRQHLGRYDSLVDAARAYDKAALELFGEFAYLNFKESIL